MRRLVDVFESVITSLYEAAAGVESWPAALAKLARASNSSGGVLVSVSTRGQLFCTTQSHQAMTEAYIDEGWYLYDEWYRAVPLLKSKGIAVDQDCLTEDQISRSPFYQD